MNQAPASVRPAATVILARDAHAGLEILMLQRTTEVAFAKGMHVFPGGALDADDHSEELAELCAGLDDATASAMLGLEKGGLAFWIAAIRECFEEAGLLLGYETENQLYQFDQAQADYLAALRGDFTQAKLSFIDILKKLQLRAATDQIHYFSHWLTQAGRPRRYDTRFFVARAPHNQIPIEDNSETIAHLWVRPQDAIEMGKVGELNLMFPTIKTLETLARFGCVDDLLAYARTPRKMPTMHPRTALGKDGQEVVLIPGDSAYAEVDKLDPQLLAQTRAFIEPGTPVKIGDQIRRLTAPNPGMMTGPGTNTYLLGSQQTGIAILDPGPADEAHIEAIMSQAGGDIRWILCTHTHKDHSPAAHLLKRRTGATLIGMPAPAFANQDENFLPDIIPQDGQALSVAGVVLTAIHTPGHASNHLCFLHTAEKLLFTGDHIMQGSTVVINPPDGHLATYLVSLNKIKDTVAEYLAPGHGFLIASPAEAVERLLIHRQSRENKVIAALRAISQATLLDTLVKHVYDDVPEGRHAVASRSLLAHLHKLQEDQRVHHDTALNTWALC